ncbi:hypothetical protein GGR56DRAFT_550248 [Xylariaceae sp. FL0804]|nr:hypothetical protein GGR56DRAFT_550248 [Xylariaceae sp. FL0804]
MNHIRQCYRWLSLTAGQPTPLRSLHPGRRTPVRTRQIGGREKGLPRRTSLHTYQITTQTIQITSTVQVRDEQISTADREGSHHHRGPNSTGLVAQAERQTEACRVTPPPVATLPALWSRFPSSGAGVLRAEWVTPEGQLGTGAGGTLQGEHGIVRWLRVTRWPKQSALVVKRRYPARPCRLLQSKSTHRRLCPVCLRALLLACCTPTTHV